MSLVRQNITYNEFGIDLIKYDELLYTVIDQLILLKFGPELCKIVYFYLYERRNPDGSLNIISNEQTKEEIKLDKPEDLWNFLEYLKSTEDKK